MKLRILIPILMILGIITCVFAWLEPASEEERDYFRTGLWNFSERKFGGFGISHPDERISISLYERQTLEPERWSKVFSEAFSLNPSNWTQVYDYILNQISESSYYESFGYFNKENETYWINNITLTQSKVTGELTSSQNQSITGYVELESIYWSFWTGTAKVGDTDYNLVLLKSNI